jgi:hypothetical protein
MRIFPDVFPFLVIFIITIIDTITIILITGIAFYFNHICLTHIIDFTTTLLYLLLILLD